MSAIEQRVNVTLDASALKAVKETAKALKTSVSKVCADLIKRRLEDDEDVYWANLVNALGDISQKKKDFCRRDEEAVRCATGLST